VQQHYVDVLRIQVLAQAVDGGLRILGVTDAVLGHPACRSRAACPGAPSPACGASRVGVRRLEEPDAPVVGVTDEAGELLLAQLSLDLAAKRAGAEGQPGHLDARVASVTQSVADLRAARPV